MPGFLDDDVLKSAVAARLKQDSKDVPPWWDPIITDANVAAHNEICSALAGRGFTHDQIDSWDRGIEFQKAIGLYWVFNDGAITAAYADTFIKPKDRREELKTVTVTVDCEMIDPEAAKGAKVSWGLMSDANEEFTQAIADRDLVDEETRW